MDVVADDTGALLAQEGLQLELLVFYDPVTEVLHAVGYDGAPARYFRELGPSTGPQPSSVDDAAGSKAGGVEPMAASPGGTALALPLTALAGSVVPPKGPGATGTEEPRTSGPDA